MQKDSFVHFIIKKKLKLDNNSKSIQDLNKDYNFENEKNFDQAENIKRCTHLIVKQKGMSQYKGSLSKFGKTGVLGTCYIYFFFHRKDQFLVTVPLKILFRNQSKWIFLLGS